LGVANLELEEEEERIEQGSPFFISKIEEEEGMEGTKIGGSTGKEFLGLGWPAF
jgi:hypothetical protein